MRWDGWVAVPKRVPSPRGLGGLVQLELKHLKTKASSPEKRRERPRPVAWPKTPPGQYQPPLCLA